MFYLCLLSFWFVVCCVSFIVAGVAEVKARNENSCKHLWMQRVLMACVQKTVVADLYIQMCVRDNAWMTWAYVNWTFNALAMSSLRRVLAFVLDLVTAWRMCFWGVGARWMSAGLFVVQIVYKFLTPVAWQIRARIRVVQVASVSEVLPQDEQCLKCICWIHDTHVAITWLANTCNYNTNHCNNTLLSDWHRNYRVWFVPIVYKCTTRCLGSFKRFWYQSRWK